MGKKSWLCLKLSIIILLVLASCAPAQQLPQSNESPSIEEPAAEPSQGESNIDLPTTVPVEEPTEEPSMEEQVGEQTPLSAEEGEGPQKEKTPSLFPTQTKTGSVNNTPIATEEMGNQQPFKNMSDENHILEFEYPQTLFYGDSDVIRLSLIPVDSGYVIESEFPDHATSSEPITIERPEGFELAGIANIDSLGFEIDPKEAQLKIIPENQEVHWRWTILANAPGSYRMNISLKLIWQPVSKTNQVVGKEYEVFSKAFEITVRSFFGLNRKQSFLGGFGSLFFSIITAIFAIFYRGKSIKNFIREIAPDKNVILESKPDIRLDKKDEEVLRAIFSGYSRILIEREFLSGYSGAKTLLVLPILTNGKRDAETIIKIGVRESIQREYDNYLSYVKHTLPPLTARIQNKPVTTKTSKFAAIKYTFVAQPGEEPVSLGALLKKENLFEETNLNIFENLVTNFGPNWWYQNSPFVYRLVQEFDKKLPSHLTVVPEFDPSLQIVGFLNEDQIDKPAQFKIGDVLELGKFSQIEIRGNGNSFSLVGKGISGTAPLRIRWESSQKPIKGKVRVVNTREELFQTFRERFELFGLCDPWDYLKQVFYQSIEGRKSIIHGDLNLENILVGAAGLVWMIDFSETREGPPVFDIAHLATELVAHIYSIKISSVDLFVNLLKTQKLNYLSYLEKYAQQCVKPGSALQEYRLALLASSLGAMKYENLNEKTRHFLYLFAAFQADQLDTKKHN